MSRHLPWFAFLGSVALLGGLIALWSIPGSDDPQSAHNSRERPPVVVHAAAALRPVLEKAAPEFQSETGIPIELRFNASELLLQNLKLTKQGDLFLPADDSYIAEARKHDLVEQDYPLATLTAIAILRADFPKDPKDVVWDDLFHPNFRLVQPNPDATAIGKVTRDGLKPSGLWSRVEASRPTMVATVTEAANAVKLGSADGAIIWDAVAAAYPTLRVARLPHLDDVTAHVAAAVCKHATNRAEARWFAEYLGSEAGQKHFRTLHYAPPKPVLKPQGPRRPSRREREIVLYAGAMLRPAIEETIKEFETRERVKVIREYNGCGILVGQMKTGVNPDLFFACDPRFMGDVADRFLKPETVSNNKLVIAVPKGNPREINALKDLGKPGLKVGVGHEQQCALGAITRETFLKSGVYAQVRKNVRVESPTGDLLVNQLLTGALDAVLCYVSNVAPNSDKLDAIPVTDIPCAAPEQPIAIAKGSARPELAAKLIEYLQSADSRARFEKLGFGWGSRKK